MTTAANPKATFHLKCSGIIDENIDPFATAIHKYPPIKAPKLTPA